MFSKRKYIILRSVLHVRDLLMTYNSDYSLYPYLFEKRSELQEQVEPYFLWSDECKLGFQYSLCDHWSHFCILQQK